MYALWKTKGVSIQPWRADVAFGAEQSDDGALLLTLRADWPWKGKLICDVPRHREYWHLPTDYPRLNQFPEWFTVEPEATYRIQISGQDTEQTRSGQQLHEGLPVQADKDQWLQISIRRTPE